MFTVSVLTAGAAVAWAWEASLCAVLRPTALQRHALEVCVALGYLVWVLAVLGVI